MPVMKIMEISCVGLATSSGKTRFLLPEIIINHDSRNWLGFPNFPIIDLLANFFRIKTFFR
jgi:hypothetical protein